MKTWAIFKKEITSYFNTPIAYIFLIIFLIIEGFFFQSFVFSEGAQSNLRSVFSITPWAFSILVPAITMRLFSEERKSGTIEILGTLPVSDFSIIFGKFLSSLALIIMAMISTFPYVITISKLGDPDLGALFSGYLGLFLLGSSFSALGIMFSSFTKNQIVAFILSFATCISLFLMGFLINLIPLGIGNIVSFLSFASHFENMTRGVVDSRDIIYFTSMIILPLFITQKTLIKRK